MALAIDSAEEFVEISGAQSMHPRSIWAARQGAFPSGRGGLVRREQTVAGRFAGASAVPINLPRVLVHGPSVAVFTGKPSPRRLPRVTSRPSPVRRIKTNAGPGQSV